MHRSWWGVLALCVTALVHAPARADSPSVQDMVRQLQPADTRGLSRNLNVVPAGQDAGGGDAQHPSLSLLIHFDFDSTAIRTESRAVVERLARALQDPGLARSRFSVEGHTDARGRPEYNQRLSERRAQAVLDALAQLGVTTERLAASGKGSGDPANAADPYAAENRRVRIINLD